MLAGSHSCRVLLLMLLPEPANAKPKQRRRQRVRPDHLHDIARRALRIVACMARRDSRLPHSHLVYLSFCCRDLLMHRVRYLRFHRRHLLMHRVNHLLLQGGGWSSLFLRRVNLWGCRGMAGGGVRVRNFAPYCPCRTTRRSACRGSLRRVLKAHSDRRWR